MFQVCQSVHFFKTDAVDLVVDVKTRCVFPCPWDDMSVWASEAGIFKGHTNQDIYKLVNCYLRRVEFGQKAWPGVNRGHTSSRIIKSQLWILYPWSTVRMLFSSILVSLTVALI